MKQLKKISLQKEELVSLNSLEMDLIRGGVGGYYEGYDSYDWGYIDWLLDNGYVKYSSQFSFPGLGCLGIDNAIYP